MVRQFFIKRSKFITAALYIFLFFWGIKALFHGFPDIERFFPEWSDERYTLTAIMKLGTFNFAPTQITHPPLFHYLAFIPIGLLYLAGRFAGLFHDKTDFVRFYFNNTAVFFLIGRAASYVFYWLSAAMVYKMTRLFQGRLAAHLTVLGYLVIPRFIFDFATTRPETLLFLTTSIFFYLFLKHYQSGRKNFLLASAFFLGLSAAAKYNAIFLGAMFIPFLFYRLKETDGDYKNVSFLALKIAFFVFLGFFTGDPFFVIKLKTYLYNLYLFDTLIVNYYDKGTSPAVFMLSHIRESLSTLYLNAFGFLILIAGAWRMYKREVKLFIFVLAAFLVFEVYFGVLHSGYSPLYLLNPLFPLGAMVVGFGISYFLEGGRKFLKIVLFLFFAVAFFNHCQILRDFSERPTYIQRARAFIEKSLPEFTRICIITEGSLPQLNLTPESYERLIKTVWPRTKGKAGPALTFRAMDDDRRYDQTFRRIRIESMTCHPQYDLIRWDKGIKNWGEAGDFLRKNNIRYIMGSGSFARNTGLAEDGKAIHLLAVFSSKNRRVYDKDALYIYGINPAQ